MKKESIKIGDLFETYSEHPEIIGEITKPKSKIFIRAKSGKIIEIVGLIKKVKSKILKIIFIDGSIKKCADKHLFETKIGFQYAESLKMGDQINTIYFDEFGNKKESCITIASIEVFGFDYVYDISMKEEFVYVTPDGIINHNSMLAIQSMGAAQRKYNGNILVSMLDSEEATTTIRMSNLGVKNPKIKPYNDITVEKVFKFLEGMCLYKEMKGIVDTPSVVVWDSVANTLSQREREVEDINSVIGYKGRLLSLLIPKYISKLSTYNICLIAINQLRDVIQIGPFTPAKELKFMSQGKTMPGGNSFKFNAFHLIEMKTKETVTRDKFGFDGYFAEMFCVKNKLFPPNIKIPIAGNFVHGFSNYWTNYRFLVDNKRMITGAWNYLADLPNTKCRTKDMLETYNTNPLFKEAFDKAVKETIQTEIIEKHNPIL